METIVNSLHELELLAAEILNTFPHERIFLLYGEMGAGKTTLVNAFCRALEVSDDTSSPTFSIVNEYLSPHAPVYHFDFYRLKHETEALDLGYEEYFYSEAYCFVEWPEKIPNLLPDKIVNITIEVLSATSRKIIAK
ncbi:MAG: tRNA (adenosine(37)-N6)-threonylcarbamoyltransferase complex ATPase subunit type 1 TsaE [Sphingobacterium sp.]